MTFDLNAWQTVGVLALVLWELVWKGFALWRAAQRNEQLWFVVLLFVNTVGVLPIVYLLLTATEDRQTVAN